MDWLTPACVLERVRRVDEIGLDPCTTADNPCNAHKFFAPERGHDGLQLGWHTYGCGLVYVNCPYGRELPRWTAKVMREAERGNNNEIILLVPSRTDTSWWHACAGHCDAFALWRGRLTFEGAPAPAPFPSCLFYWGARANAFKRVFCDVARVMRGGGSP
jgi:site-specific DNA-methyltransferase (adenine-specific)